MSRLRSLHPLASLLVLWAALFLILGCTALVLSSRALGLTLTVNTDSPEELRVSWGQEGGDYDELRSARVLVKPFQSTYFKELIKWGWPHSIRLEQLTRSGAVNVKSLRLGQPGFNTQELLARRERLIADARTMKDVASAKLGEPSRTLEMTVPSRRFTLRALRFALWNLALSSLMIVVGVVEWPHPRRLIRYDRIWLPAALVTAAVLVICLAWLSPINSHPDEIYHLNAAKYYRNAWLPPKICDESTLDSYSPYGFSYLQTLDVVYFLAGKFSSVIVLNPFSTAKVYRCLRFFNVLLFILLLGLSVRCANRAVFFPLVITPQLWYVFGYFNSDAFPLVTSFLLAWYLTEEDSGLRRYLFRSKRSHWGHAAAAAVLFAFLLLSKPNYYVFIVFAIAYLFFLFWFNDRKWVVLKRIVVVLLGAAVLFGARVGLDVVIYGEKRAEQASECAERLADPNCKPSLWGKQEGFWGLHMKDRGVSYTRMFRDHPWVSTTWKSFFGVYGWMEFQGPLHIYLMATLVGLVLLGQVVAANLVNANPVQKSSILLFLMSGAVTIFISSLFSWIHDFQAQGRYLFPILPMLGVVLAPVYARNNYVGYAVLLMFAISCYSFVEVGLVRYL